MDIEEKKQTQKAERTEYLNAILESTAEKKLIVAGPGTGKTYTFGRIMELKAGANNLALTFIKKLVEDMRADLGENAETKTFHAYCKKILHERNGRVELVPYLTKVIEKDASILGRSLEDFETKFRTLDEASAEVTFYLARGDYYDAVSFDDSVYRLYKLLQSTPSAIPLFDQIVIDEFQDFNPLEVAFIGELEKRGPTLIVGDDDQAVYGRRSASPDYLRSKYQSGEYVKFELPFCSRCPEPIVSATNAVIKAAQARGLLQSRIPKQYECYIEDKERDTLRYPKLITAQCSTVKIVPKYIQNEIERIDAEDIAESNREGRQYPTVLIIGPKQYLREVEKQLSVPYPQLSYSPNQDPEYGLEEAYRLLLKDTNSNLGWRILVELFHDLTKQREILTASESGTPMFQLLDANFIARHLRVLALITRISEAEAATGDFEAELTSIISDYAKEIIEIFRPVEEDKMEFDETEPTILLKSYVGSKGLSAGHVFIVGANNGSMPRDPNHIADVEIAQFIVGLTRTRKQCHLIANKWFYSPKTKKGNLLPRLKRSEFLSWIPASVIEDKGEIAAKDLK